MNRILGYAGQAAVYAVVGALIAYFSTSPAWRSFADGDALIRLGFAHGGKHKHPCHRRTPEELRKLAPNMRKPVSCPRERLPVLVVLEVDGRVILEREFPPTGLSGDGPSSVYIRHVVPAGRHTLAVKMRDSKRASGFDYSLNKSVELAPRQNLAVRFRADLGAFLLE